MTRFDPHDADFLQNPYPAYADILASQPTFYHEPSKLWFFTRHKDVDSILRDRRFGRSILHVMNREELDLPAPRPKYAPFNRIGEHSLFDKEPPQHTRLRGLVHKAFTPRRIREMQSSIEFIANQLADKAQQAGQIDLLEDFAAALSVTVIAELLGIPEADRNKLRPWSNAIVKLYELDHTPEQAAAAIHASEEFAEYLKAIANDRRQNPRNDLITALVEAEEAGDKLTEDELVSTCVLLLNAGHEATVNVVGNGWLTLFRNPEQRQKLQADLSLIPTAIEELMRYDSPLQLFKRWVLEDLTYDGVELKRGMQVGLIFGAANNDPATFHQPRTLDITRDPNPHVSFGGGIHYCLGAPLARMELQIAYSTLIQRFPHMQPIEEPEFIPAYVIHGLKALHVQL